MIQFDRCYLVENAQLQVVVQVANDNGNVGVRVGIPVPASARTEEHKTVQPIAKQGLEAMLQIDNRRIGRGHA